MEQTETELWKARLKSLINTLFVLYFKTIDSYNRLNITNANLYCENEKLTKINDKLTHKNENHRAENKDYKLLRKVFSNKRIDNLLERVFITPQKRTEACRHLGQHHLRYIKQHKRVFYANLLTSCKLNSYLAGVDEEAENLFLRLIKQLIEKENVT